MVGRAGSGLVESWISRCVTASWKMRCLFDTAITSLSNMVENLVLLETLCV